MQSVSPDHAEIVRRFGPALFALAQQWTSNSPDALDLVQDTFERSLRRLSPSLPPAKVQSWLQVTLRNRCIDLRRFQERRNHLQINTVQHPMLAQEDPYEIPPWDRVDPHALWNCVNSLSAPLREVFLLRNRDHLTYAEIATQMSIPISTVGTRHYRAVKHLRAELEKRLDNC